MAAELAGVPGVELTHVFGVLALAYGRSTPFEAAKCVLDGLAELREEAPGLVIPQ